MEYLILVVLVAAAVGFIYSNRNRKVQSEQVTDELADARRWTERLSGQILAVDGADAASARAMSDAAEHQRAAALVAQASTVRQARLARDRAVLGLYYVRAARTAMGLDAGPPLPALEGQDWAGEATETREVEFEGRQVAVSPVPGARTPHHHPGGRVAGRPIPAGWYSEPWWQEAADVGAWPVGSERLFDALLAGMGGVSYDAQAFEEGYDGEHEDGTDSR